MARPFSIHTLLRQTPNRYLRDFFRRLGCGDLGLAWDHLKERDVAPIITALSDLPRKKYEAVEAELHHVFDLACDTGLHALVEAALCCGAPDLARELPEEGTHYEKAMWARLHQPDAFQTATVIFQVERLNWWRKRADLPKREPDPSPETLARLGRELGQLLWAEQARGRRCTVETFRRRDTTYYFAHPDDYVQNVQAHDEDGVLAPRTFRQTFLVVFAFNAKEGTLELFAKGPGKLKNRLEGVFAEVVLGHTLGEWIAKPSYTLNHLISPDCKLVTDPGDGVAARIRKLRLDLKNSKRRITLEADPEAPPEDIYRMMEEVLERRNVPPSSVYVGLVTFTFEFEGANGRKGGSMTFDVAWPSSCNLRDHRPEYVEVALKYLKRWGIDAGDNRGVAPQTARP